MESCLLDLAKNEVQSLVNLVKNEAQYLCCFNSYVENFEQKKKILAAKHKDVKRKFQKGKGVYSFKFEAKEWERDADDIIHVDSKIKKKLFFDWCPNYWWQYRRGKELAEKTQHIESLLERCNSNIVAGRANVSDIKYLSSEGFIHFESRESKFQDLFKALLDENCNMIGLQGLGGTGKTSMAKEVGNKLKESKLIDKFIFLVVSQPPDFKKIRGELAKSLDPELDKVKEEEVSSSIFSKITNMDEKLLIILDDVWVQFDLTENLGIPFGHQHKGCNLLITTRNSHVCIEMGCHMIQLQTLTNEEASNLFEAHTSLNSSYRGFKGMPKKIVKHCGGVPIAIVAVARALKNQPISVWKDALKTLEDRGLDQNLEEAYKCLRLSYDNLKNQKAKELLLISSLFPEDFEIPIELLIKIGIGLGSFNENDKYHLIRSKVHGAIMELIHSSLWLNGEEEHVKLHDLVREVALWIGENDIQSLLDMEKPIKGNLRYLFWKNNKFLDEFDGEKLEVLLIFLDNSESLNNATGTYFKKMTSLKVLVLVNNDERCPALSLMNSFQPLKFIQTLILVSLELGDISTLGNLSSLMTIWFLDCSIIELPEEFLNLKKLRLLEIESCKIEKNNPFEVIEMCSQLEELTFVDNECDDEEKDAISQNVYPLRLHRYYISSEDDLSDYFEKNGSISRYFRVDQLGHLVSDSTFKQLVGRAEVLLLEGEDVQKIWKNLVPDVVSIEKEGVMNDLIALHLSIRPDMECLICTKNHDPDVTAFCNLAELHLSKVGVEDLCRGPLPSGFLEQLEILKLTECHKLKSILFNGNYNLCHLKSVQLEDCPKLMSVFQPYTAQNLKQLEELIIRNCSALEYIIVGADGDSNQKSYYDSLFPSLQEMELSGVPSFIGIVREYHQLMSSSIRKLTPPLSRHNSRSLNQSLATRAFSWVQACYSLNKLRSASKEMNSGISEYRSLDHINPPIFDLVQSVKNVREIELVEYGTLVSLSTLSIAASTIALKILKIRRCHKLKCITTHEEDAHVDKNNCSIFPTLEELLIEACDELEILFVSSISVDLEKLKSLTILRVPKLKYVVGNYQMELCPSNHNQNDELCFNLPVLETLSIEYAPMMNIICPKKYNIVNSTTTEDLDASTYEVPYFNATQSLLVQSLKNVREIRLLECGNIISLSTLSIAASTIALETLIITRCHKLKCIITHEGDAQVDRNNCSIFPTLEKLIMDDCDELEILFVSSISVGLEKLKFLSIQRVPKLKYVVDNCQKEQPSSDQNQTDELHFNLPALETLHITHAPIMNGICSKNYKLLLSSLKNVQMWNCGIKSFTDNNMVNLRTTQIVDASTDRGTYSLAAQSLLVQSVKNVREIELVECGNIISLSILSIAASTIALETLIIVKCHELKCITTHEGDAHVDRNNCSIFPSLKELKVKNCDELEILFVSTIPVGLEKLKSLTIRSVPKLKYVVGNYQKELYPSNQNQNDELCFNLLSLETLNIENAPMMNGIFCKKYNMVNLTTTEIVDASTDRGVPSLASRSLLVQSVKNVREIELVECGNIISLSTLSIASSTIALETLIICECHKLKCITTDKGDTHVYKNNYSIFPTLKWLSIEDCEELEMLFVSSISVGLKKLKSLTIEEVPKLKYVVGNYQKELCPSNQYQNDELCFNFPALETLNIENAPMMNGICSKKYKLELSSHLNNEIENCSNKSFTEEVHATTNGAPLFHVTQNLLKNIREIELVECAKLISLTTLSIASTMLLEVLRIRACDQLKCVVADEGHARTKINYNSIFPKLKQLEVSNCNALEYLFPAYAFRFPLYLESLEISKAPILQYVFGRSQHDGCLNPKNQNIQILINFPALKSLTIGCLPKLVSIYPENYHMKRLYLRSVELPSPPEFTMRPLNEFFICWHSKQQETKVIEMCWKTLDSLKVCDFQIEDIFDLTYMKIEEKGGELQPLTSSLRYLELRNLSDLMNICVGPKCIIHFDSLQDLTIAACKNLRVIFSASMVRSLPMLWRLRISRCEELVHIVEEDYETNADDHLPHEPCFPNLKYVSVLNCDKLKYLFSITISDILPELIQLEISEANELEHVLINRDEMEEMLMKNVLPKLRLLELGDLPNLVSVCNGINFQKEDYPTRVHNCPKFDTSTTRHQRDPENGNSQVEEKAKERLSSHMVEETQQSPTKGATEEIVEEDFMPEIAKMTISSFDSKLTRPLVVEPRAKGVSTNTLYQVSPTSEKEVPIPTSDITHSFAKILEEEEEEQGGLITSRHLQSSIKASNSLSKDKLKTSIEGDLFAPPVTIVLNEQTSQAILPPSTRSSKASTSLNQAPSSIISKASNGIDHGDIKEAGMVQNEYKFNIEPSNLTQREQESSYSKGQIRTKDQLTDLQPRIAIPTTPFVTILEDEYSEGGIQIVEIRGEEGALILENPHPSFLTSRVEPIPMSLDSTSLSRSPSTTVKIFEEEEKGGLITTPRHESDMKVVSSLPPGKEHKTSNQGDPFMPPMPVISSEQQAFDTILPLSFVPSKALTSPKQIFMSASSQSTYSGQLVECGSSEKVSSICETKNASSVVEVKEIVNMMKLEGVEPSMLAEAFKAKPQLYLSLNDRSTELLCYSYRVLLNILNILATRSPFTITEADKILLAKNLKDASVLGFDNDWLKYIRMKVFHCDASELHHKQQVLKSLGNKLEANKRELANVRNQEAQATQSVEMGQKELEAAYKGLEAAQSHLNVAQQEYTNIRVRHSQLLEECQEILEQRDQCSEIIAAKLRPFGF